MPPFGFKICMNLIAVIITAIFDCFTQPGIPGFGPGCLKSVAHPAE